MDFKSVYDFGKQCDLVTCNLEHINVDALEKLEERKELRFLVHQH